MAELCESSAFQPAGGESPKPGHPPRILVVEDNGDILRHNIAALRMAGYVADGAEDGARAWSALQAAAYDLVITDNDMPHVTGVELIAKIHSAKMALPVIMATGTFPEEELSRDRLPMPAATLLKPYNFADLVGTVKQVLTATNSDDS